MCCVSDVHSLCGAHTWVEGRWGCGLCTLVWQALEHVYSCVCTPLCMVSASVDGCSRCEFLPLHVRVPLYVIPAICAVFPGFAVAAQLCGMCGICCGCARVCAGVGECAHLNEICMTGGGSGSPSLPPFSLPPSFPPCSRSSREQGAGGDLSHVPCWWPPCCDSRPRAPGGSGNLVLEPFPHPFCPTGEGTGQSSQGLPDGWARPHQAPHLADSFWNRNAFETDSDLPAGWMRVQDTSGTYYWHIPTGTTQWEPPGRASPSQSQGSSPREESQVRLQA